jgi:hypothetical protein
MLRLELIFLHSANGGGCFSYVSKPINCWTALAELLQN